MSPENLSELNSPEKLIVALAEVEKRTSKDNPELLPYLDKLVENYLKPEFYPQAENIGKRAQAIREKIGNHQESCLALQKLGWICTLQNNDEAAEKYFLEAWDVINSAESKSIESLVQGLRPLIYHYLKLDKFEKAEQTLANMLALYEKSEADPNYQAAYCLAVLAVLNSLQNKPADSLRYSEQAAQIIKNRCASGYAVDFLSLAEIVSLYLAQGRIPETKDTAMATLLENEDNTWPANPIASASLAHLAEAFRAQGKFKQAESIYKRALAVKAIDGDETSSDFALLALNLGNMYLALKKYADAEPLLKSAMKARVRIFGVEHPAVASCLETYVTLLKRTKRITLANKLDLRAREIRSRYVSRLDKQNSA